MTVIRVVRILFHNSITLVPQSTEWVHLLLQSLCNLVSSVPNIRQIISALSQPFHPRSTSFFENSLNVAYRLR